VCQGRPAGQRRSTRINKHPYRLVGTLRPRARVCPGGGQRPSKTHGKAQRARNLLSAPVARPGRPVGCVGCQRRRGWRSRAAGERGGHWAAATANGGGTKPPSVHRRKSPCLGSRPPPAPAPQRPPKRGNGPTPATGVATECPPSASATAHECRHPMPTRQTEGSGRLEAATAGAEGRRSTAPARPIAAARLPIRPEVLPPPAVCAAELHGNATCRRGRRHPSPRHDTGGGCADSAVTTTGNGRTNRGEKSIIVSSPPPPLLPPPPRRRRRHPRQAPTAVVALGQDPHSTITRPRAIRTEGNKRDTPAETETAGRGNSNKPGNRLGAPRGDALYRHSRDAECQGEGERASSTALPKCCIWSHSNR